MNETGSIFIRHIARTAEPDADAFSGFACNIEECEAHCSFAYSCTP